jgi:hypothetical protein
MRRHGCFVEDYFTLWVIASYRQISKMSGRTDRVAFYLRNNEFLPPAAAQQKTAMLPTLPLPK